MTPQEVLSKIEVGKIFKELRGDRSQMDIAVAAGHKSQVLISQLETGRACIPFLSIEKNVKAYTGESNPKIHKKIVQLLYPEIYATMSKLLCGESK